MVQAGYEAALVIKPAHRFRPEKPAAQELDRRSLLEGGVDSVRPVNGPHPALGQ